MAALPPPPHGWSSKKAMNAELRMNAELTGEEGRGKSYEWKHEIFFSTPFAGGVEKAEVTITSGGRTFRYLKLHSPPLLLPFKTITEKRTGCASRSMQNPLPHWAFWRRRGTGMGEGGSLFICLTHHFLLAASTPLHWPAKISLFLWGEIPHCWLHVIKHTHTHPRLKAALVERIISGNVFTQLLPALTTGLNYLIHFRQTITINATSTCHMDVLPKQRVQTIEISVTRGQARLLATLNLPLYIHKHTWIAIQDKRILSNQVHQDG